MALPQPNGQSVKNSLRESLRKTVRHRLNSAGYRAAHKVLGQQLWLGIAVTRKREIM